MNNMIRWLPMTMAILSAMPAHAQQRIETVDSLLVSRFDLASERLLRIFENHYTISHPDSIARDIRPLKGVGDFVKTHNFHLLKGILTLVKSGSGPVFQDRAGKLVRIDHSLDHRFQENAVEFVLNDTLYRHGGYGLWEAHNFISYFSETTLEWEILRPIGGTEFPPGLFLHHVQMQGKQVYFYGGFIVNPWNRIEQVFKDAVGQFDFRTKQWTRLGITHPILREMKWNPGQGADSETSTIAYISHNNVTLLNAAENLIDHHELKPEFFRLLAYVQPRSFQHGDHFHFYKVHETDSGKFQPYGNFRFDYIRITTKALTSESGERHPFYLKPGFTLSIWLLFLPIAGVTFWLVFRRRTGPATKAIPVASLHLEGIRYNGLDYKLEPAALKVLRLLLSRVEDVESKEISDLVAKPTLDYPNQVRTKNLIIRALNLELRSIFRTDENIIIQTDSPTDRRIKCYRINRSWFSEISTPGS